MPFIKPLQYSRGCAPADCNQVEAGAGELRIENGELRMRKGLGVGALPF